MSGQPYRKATDIDKFRNQYMEALDLQAGINALNYEANMNFLQTGVLPPVSTMKDSRSVEDKLRDFEMLKQDISATIASVSSKQFGSLVVQTIINSPLNVDNKLLVYTAQRIDDIIKQLSKIYKYGIRGDINDAEQFTRFIEKMFTDTSAMTASTKEFMNRYSERSLLGSQYDQVINKLTQVGARMQNIKMTLNDYITIIRPRRTSVILVNRLSSLVEQINHIANFIGELLSSIPKNVDEVKYIENGLLFLKPRTTEAEVKYRAVIDFINSGLPNVGSLSVMMERFNKYIINITKGLNIIKNEPADINIQTLSIYSAILDSIKDAVEYISSIQSILQPLGDEYSVENIKDMYTELIRLANRFRGGPEIVELEPEPDPDAGVFGNDMGPAIIDMPNQPEPRQPPAQNQQPEPAPGFFEKVRRLLSPKRKPAPAPAPAGPSGSGMRKSRGRGRPRTKK